MNGAWRVNGLIKRFIAPPEFAYAVMRGIMFDRDMIYALAQRLR